MSGYAWKSANFNVMPEVNFFTDFRGKHAIITVPPKREIPQ